MTDFLRVRRGNAPVIVSVPHAGTEIPKKIEAQLVSPWLARKDTDWWVDELYGFAHELGATTVRTTLSRTVIDVNRDPSGKSLYPGQKTSALCPLATFDDEPLYLAGQQPDAAEIAFRTENYFAPYHAALAVEIARLRAMHPRVVLYDAHSIRSRVAQLFDGELPHLNIGTNSGRSCEDDISHDMQAHCVLSGFTSVIDGRFKGGWITRHYGEPARGVHAVQMELACRGYMREPDAPATPDNWPTPFDAAYASAMRATLRTMLEVCLVFATRPEDMA